jgi:hypothetical protein
MSNTKHEINGDEDGRYRTIEYSSDSGMVTIIQDSENDNAWIQSDQLMEVRR